jgi:hypothetical protein
MVKIKTLILIGVFILSSLVIGCTNKYRVTGEACNGAYHMEFYQVNPFGVDAVYLTDSSTFRVYLGDIDEGNQCFKIECSADSIYINKLGQRGHSIEDTVELSYKKETFALRMLRRDHKYK